MKIFKKLSLLSIVLMFAVVGGLGGCAKVDPGQGGVLWTAWGGTQEQIYSEGWYFVAPWNRMYTYNVRTQDRPEELHVLASNGLSIRLETSVRFRPKSDELPRLHRTIGPNYYDVILAPAIRSAARKVGGRYTPEEIYSTKREMVEQEIFNEVIRSIENPEAVVAAKEKKAPTVAADTKARPVVLEAILVRNVDLPEKLKRAINEKLEEEQRALMMEFTLKKERQEAERKKIEALGTADRNDIITKSINDKLLRYKGIEVTEKLANSNNAKVVIIGSGKDGLPIILGDK